MKIVTLERIVIDEAEYLAFNKTRDLLETVLEKSMDDRVLSLTHEAIDILRRMAQVLYVE